MSAQNHYLIPYVRQQHTSPVTGVLDGEPKLPSWNPALEIASTLLPFKFHRAHLSPHLGDYGRMTQSQIAQWCHQRQLPVNKHPMTNLKTIFSWLSDQGYLTPDQQTIFQLRELWAEDRWAGKVLDLRAQLPAGDYQLTHPLFNNGRLDNIDSFEFRWWYLSIEQHLPTFSPYLQVNRDPGFDPSKILTWSDDQVYDLIGNRLSSISDDYILPQLKLFYRTDSLFQVLAQVPTVVNGRSIESYMTEIKNYALRQSVDMLPAPIKSRSAVVGSNQWDPFDYYRMNILAYTFALSSQDPALPELKVANQRQIIDMLPYLGDQALFQWLNVYLLYTDRRDLEHNLALVLQLPQYFIAPWTTNEIQERKLYYGTYWQRQEADRSTTPRHIIKQYQTLGLLS